MKQLDLQEIRTTYTEGTRIKLIKMLGESIPRGTIGVVTKVDDIGQIHIKWLGPQYCGLLAINKDLDEFEIID